MITKSITVKGAVQGVGYRPFIAEIATEYGLTGYVYNSGASVSIMAMGEDEQIEAFISHIENNAPAGAFVLSLESQNVTDKEAALIDGYKSFEIIESKELDLSSELPVFLPDIGICPDCMREMLNPLDRRYRYPLISCAVCGPRMSILDSLPYDRENTTMADFEMCSYCKMDFKKGRRRYAQTVSCHDCGPQILFKAADYSDSPADTDIQGEAAIRKAISLLEEGGIIGLKGISGYQLLSLPTKDAAERLRRIKGRENKPFAIMFSDIEMIRHYAVVSQLEEELLMSSARPIVLLNIKHEFPEEVIKKSRYIGGFLPSAGVHRLLTDELGPLIVTSANKSDEPMITDDEAFLSVFMGNDAEDNVDGVLYHKRRINMAQDDSVVFVISHKGKEYMQFIRRARGYAPLPILLDKNLSNETEGCSVLALGGDLKSCFSLGKKDRIIPSQYVGDLEDYNTNKYYDKLLGEYMRIFAFKPDVLVRDKHPMYILTTKSKELCKKLNIADVSLQHHFAHTYSCMSEHDLTKAIGVSFDGTGYGDDGRIWGGEFLYCDREKTFRKGHLQYVKLSGGDEAPKNADTVAYSYIYEAVKRKLISEKNSVSGQEKLIRAALDNNVNCFETSSAGRLFDAVSSLLDICHYNTYEGECAIMLESIALDFAGKKDDCPFPEFDFEIKQEEGGFSADQTGLFAQIYDCINSGKFDTSAIAYGFHMAICDLIIRGCLAIREETGENKVCLSGGVFNNRLLLTHSVSGLLENGFEVYWNNKVPLGDGGISAGQAYYGLLCGSKILEK